MTYNPNASQWSSNPYQPRPPARRTRRRPLWLVAALTGILIAPGFTAAAGIPAYQPRIVSPSGAYQRVSCASKVFCVAVSDEAWTVYRGSGWSRPQPSRYGRGFIPPAVSCPSAHFCLEVVNNGSTSQVTRFDGHQWNRPRAIPGLPNITALSCGSTRFCVAAGPRYLPDDVTSDALASILTGHTWSQPQRLFHAILGSPVVSCHAKTCVLLATSGHAAQWRAGHWRSIRAMPGPVVPIDDLSCPTPNACIALSTYEAGAWNGKTWKVDDFGGPPNPAWYAVSCATAKRCIAGGAGSQGDALSSVTPVIRRYDGRWRAPMKYGSRAATQIAGISCPSVAFCAAAQTPTPGQ